MSEYTVTLYNTAGILDLVCPDLDDPPYGSVNVTDNTNGSTAHYECDEGFELVGDAYRECQDNGYWSGDIPMCESMYYDCYP